MKVSFTPLMFVLLSISLGATASVCFAQTQNSVTPPFALTGSVEPSTVMVSEPLRVKIRFSPKTQKDVAILAGDEFKWCRFEIVQGNKVVVTWELSRRVPTMMHNYPWQVVELQKKREVITALPSDVMRLPTGDYVLRLTTHIKYDYDVRASSLPDGDNFNMAQDQVVNIPFTVKELDVLAMKERVSKLYRALGRETNDQAIREMSRELAILPAEYASRAWRSLLFDKTISGSKRYAIARILSTQATKPIADTLLDVQYTDPIRDENGKIITLLTLLSRMFSGGKDDVHDHILREMIKHQNSPFNTPIRQEGLI